MSEFCLVSSFVKELRRQHYCFPCFLFEMQRPHLVWRNNLLGWWAYVLHDLLCPEMWLIRMFPRWLDS